ncbi:hypothetical protein [Bradyrhizobium sp. DOA1]|nr:hypothetical protein [Bradyrhizobium sp. DOA1]
MLLMLTRCHRFMGQNLGGNHDIGLQNYIEKSPAGRRFHMRVRTG